MSKKGALSYLSWLALVFLLAALVLPGWPAATVMAQQVTPTTTTTTTTNDADTPPPDPRPVQSAGVSVAAGSHYGSSPFAPPEPDDATFVVDVAPGLDTGCTFRSGGPLLFDVKIDRYPGDIQKLRANGYVGATAVLRLPAYDVDLYGGGGSIQPELDRISFNGRVLPGEYLSGDNNIWKLNAFNVPLEWINFPSDPGDGGTLSPSTNTIRIDIDAANSGQYWCTSIDWAALSIEVPRPVLMAHGILSSGSTWGLWTNNLANIGLPSATLDMGKLDSIQNNAGKIANRVEGLKRRWGVKKLNILAHSKGGLDSRQYVENNESVDKVIQLGTPNAGSPLADTIQGGAIVLVGILGTAIIDALAGPASYQLTTPYMGLYNSTHGYNANVSYTSLAGDYNFGGLGIVNAIVRSFYGGRNDTVVPVWSVHTLGYASHLTFSSSGGNKQAQHTSMTASTGIYSQILPLLTQPGAGARVVEAAGPAAESTSALAITSAPVSTAPIGDSLSQGQTKTYTLPVDTSSPVLFTLYHTSGQVEMELISPSGQQINPTVAAASTNIDYQTFGDSEQQYKMYGLSNPEVGQWTLRVSAPVVANSSGTEPFILTGLVTNSPVQLQVSSDRKSYSAGQPVVLQAKVLGGAVGSAARVTTKIIRPDGTYEVVNLADNGLGDDTVANDGVYSGRFSTTQPGLYRTLFTASGNTTAFSRSEILLVPVSASTSVLNGSFSAAGADTDGDGLFNNLTVNVGLNITAAANYRVLGVLSDKNGVEIASTTTVGALQPGSQNVALRFDGERIFDHAVDGPYTLSLVRLAEDNAGNALPLDERTAALTTAAYSYNQFQHPGIYVPGTGTDQGIDTNNNGRFDLFKVSLDVKVTATGYYNWSGHLVDRNGNELGFNIGFQYLIAGQNNTITFTFDGNTIGRNGVDGPYYLNDVLIFNGFNSAAIFRAYTTSAYPVSKFEGAPVVVNPLLTRASVSPAPNQAGWNNTAVQVTLEATGGNSGVKQITYSTSGAQTRPVTVVPGALATIMVGSEGTTSLTFYATDNAGNQEPLRTFTVKVDQTPPTVSYTGNTGQYTIDQVVAISCSATDPAGGSGLASNTCKDLNAAAYTLPLGVNTLSATAEDVAGNTGNGSTSFTVKVTYGSLCGLTGQFLAATAPQLTNSFCAKLNAAESAAARGNQSAKDGALQAYRNEVSAKTGKVLTTEQAQVLTQLSYKL